MDPLAVVEEKLGIVDTWPSSVLTDMFYNEPKVSVSSRFAAFLHGNVFSVRDAAKLYKVSQAAWRNVSEYVVYSLWLVGIIYFIIIVVTDVKGYQTYSDDGC